MPPRRARGPNRDDPDASDGPPSVDLHGLRPELALRRLEQALHAARVRGQGELLVITGRGQGNERGAPVLRRRVDEWLRGPGGAAFGARVIEVTAKGGALRVRLG